MKKQLLMLGAVLVMSSSVGCAPPAAPPATSAASTSPGQIFHALAQKSTTAKLGIAKWHCVVEKKTGALVYDGVDKSGKLKFSSSFTKSKDGNFVVTDHITRGRMVFDPTGKIKEHSLSERWGTQARALRKDWNAYQQMTAYSMFQDIADAGLVGWGGVQLLSGLALLPVAPELGIPELATLATGPVGQGLALMASGTYDSVTRFLSDSEKEDVQDQMKKQDAADDAAEDAAEAQKEQDQAQDAAQDAEEAQKEADAQQDELQDAKDGEPNNLDPKTVDEDEDAEPDTEDDAGDIQGDDFPNADDGADLDDLDLQADSDDFGGFGDLGDGDLSGDLGDDLGGGDDFGGDDGFSTGKCRKTAKSKSSGIAICLRY